MTDANKTALAEILSVISLLNSLQNKEGFAIDYKAHITDHLDRVENHLRALTSPAENTGDDVLTLAHEAVQSHYPSHREYKIAAALIAALAPRQVDVDDLKIGDPKSGSPETAWKFVEGYNQAIEDLAELGLIGNADHFVQSPNMVEKIEGLEEALATNDAVVCPSKGPIIEAARAYASLCRGV